MRVVEKDEEKERAYELNLENVKNSNNIKIIPKFESNCYGNIKMDTLDPLEIKLDYKSTISPLGSTDNKEIE